MKIQIKRQDQLLKLDTIYNNLLQYKGKWIMINEISSIDMEMKKDIEKETIMHVFQQAITSFSDSIQFIYKKRYIDFSKNIATIKSNTKKSFDKVKRYAEYYSEYLEEISKGKLKKEGYIIIQTPYKTNYDEGKLILESIKKQVESIFSLINITLNQIDDFQIKNFFPKLYDERIDYAIVDNEYKRTYIIRDYPRNVYPNWLKTMLDFPYPIEISQHIRPFSMDTVISAVEKTVVKIESTIGSIEDSGFNIPTELKVKKDDANNLLLKLASGETRMYDVGFYVTIIANSLEELNSRSVEAETMFRSLYVGFRRARKEMDKAIKSMLPLANNELHFETYTFDTKSLSTILPLTSQNYLGKDGVLYGINAMAKELILLDRYNMPNPNMVVLGKSGYGKSMFAKIETARNIINGSQGIIIDHNYEWKDFCELLGGQYVEDNEKPNWKHHLIVLNGNKAEALKTIWRHIQLSPLQKRLLVIDEFHNVLQNDSKLILQVVKEIRKYYVALTLITQNVRDFLRLEEGQMIMDNCSIKMLFRQGENDMQVLKDLFNLSRQEQIYLQSVAIGQGYLYTDFFKTKIRISYSSREEDILTTNPKDKIEGCGINVK